MAAEAAAPGRSLLLRCALTALAVLLVFWNASERYLWQDEAACAVMAERLFEMGKPYGYADGNLITMDVFRREDGGTLAYETATPEQAVRTFVERGDFKQDTTWIGQPWGQFVLAGASLSLLGHGTLQARLPFLLAAVLTIWVLFGLVRRRFGDPWLAGLAVLLCLGSVYWLLHMRQCRYYASATLFLLLTLAAYLRWQDARRLGATAFVVSAWLWFHNDFGSFWPVMIVLGLDALRVALRDRATRRAALVRVFVVFGCLAVVVLPFAWYYELWTRHKQEIAAFPTRFFVTLYFLNQYQLPLVLLPALGLLAWRARRVASAAEWRLVWLCAAIVVAQLVFMTAVGPYGFYRYIVDCTPLASLVTAFLIVRGLPAVLGREPGARAARVASVAAGLVALVTPWLSEPGRRLIPIPGNFSVTLPPPGVLVRDEWTALGYELSGSIPDPNRMAVEFLREHLEPGDEVLINYEDIPLMFYLPGHRIRGGIQCFRLQDPSPKPPRFVLIRKRPRICHRAAYDEAFARLALRRIPWDAPDIAWGNNPDPSGHFSRYADDLDEMGLWECIGWR